MSVLLVGHLKISAGGHLRPDCAKCRDGQHAIRNQVEEVQWLTWKKHSISSELAQKMVDKAVAKARELGVSENVAILVTRLMRRCFGRKRSKSLGKHDGRSQSLDKA
jgi:hypothetical protein